MPWSIMLMKWNHHRNFKGSRFVSFQVVETSMCWEGPQLHGDRSSWVADTSRPHPVPLHLAVHLCPSQDVNTRKGLPASVSHASQYVWFRSLWSSGQVCLVSEVRAALWGWVLALVQFVANPGKLVSELNYIGGICWLSGGKNSGILHLLSKTGVSH
jgi:hypothetical protein